MNSPEEKLCRLTVTETESGASIEFDLTRPLAKDIFFPGFQQAKRYRCDAVYGDGHVESQDDLTPQELSTLLHDTAKAHSLIYQGESDQQVSVPSGQMFDITEQILLGSDKIPASVLAEKDRGLLAGSGRRVLSYEFTGEVPKMPAPDVPQQTAPVLRFQTADGKDVDQRLEFEGSRYVTPEEHPAVKFELDTDHLNTLFAEPQFKGQEFLVLRGTVDIPAQVPVPLPRRKPRSVMLHYPVEFALVNPNPSVFRNINPYAASIDFGTSSTCVAVKPRGGNAELLALSASEQGGNPYENPTNLMIFDWDGLYEAWIKDLDSHLPVIERGDSVTNIRRMNAKQAPVQFDVGYDVRALLEDPQTKKDTLNAIMSLLKLVPYNILEDKRQLRFSPWNQKSAVVHLIASPSEQDTEKFDPVAFYSYLIGRMINDRSKRSEIQTHFQITVPVKFNATVREALETSLRHGLQRSVPEPMRELVHVEATNMEPVAYIGALCGTEFLRVTDEPVRVAVFDFGGGTLDYAFGTVSSDFFGNASIDLASVGGNAAIGGERIIEQIAFELYVHNYSTGAKLSAEGIPMLQPAGIQVPDHIHPSLLAESEFSRANMNIISRYARKLFEGRDQASTEKVRLYNQNGDLLLVTLSIPTAQMRQSIRDHVREAVQAFVAEMDAAFEISGSEERAGIHVYLAGNASKNQFVGQCMIEELSGPNGCNCDIIMPNQLAEEQQTDGTDAPTAEDMTVDTAETDSEENASSQRRRSIRGTKKAAPRSTGAGDATAINVFRQSAITPKTAVALGQLRLPGIEVRMSTNGFTRNLGYCALGNGELRCVIKKGTSSDAWIPFNRVVDGQIQMYHSEQTFNQGNIGKTPYHVLQNEVGPYLYVRVKDPATIQFCSGDYGIGSNIEVPDTAIIREMKFGPGDTVTVETI